MLRRLLLPLLLLLPCLNCRAPSLLPPQRNPPPNFPAITVPVFVDAGIDDQRRVYIRWTIDQWNTALNGYEHFVLLPDRVSRPFEDTDVRKVRIWSEYAITVNMATPDDVPDDFEPNQGNVLAWTIPHDNDVFLVGERLDKRAVWMAVSLHEFGHLMGENDMADGTLMDGNVDAGQLRCIDWKTLNRIAKRRGWDVAHMNTTCH